jgi:hypothetical protein
MTKYPQLKTDCVATEERVPILSAGNLPHRTDFRSMPGAA